MSKRYTYEYVKDYFESKGFVLLSDSYNTCKDVLYFQDKNGYIYCSTFDKFLNRGVNGKKVHPCNKYSIHNINILSKLNNYPSICISNEYIHVRDCLKFKCSCGNVFETPATTFMSGHKIRCDACSGYKRYEYEDIKQLVSEKGYILLTSKDEYTNVGNDKISIQDKEGYRYFVMFNEFMRKGNYTKRVHKINPFSIYNINLYLEQNNIPFICVSTEYISKRNLLQFKCSRCGEVVDVSWDSVNRNDNHSRLHVICPYCDRRIESLHASVLKQVFLHEYPDTIVEDKSYRNPDTKAIRPTDIVNHRLKIAIEVQSQFHDYEDTKQRDILKRKFWTAKGYKFYAPDIRDYSILELLQVFFNIEEIPDYVNMNLYKGPDLKHIQELLLSGNSVIDIATVENIKPHIIYDAIYSKKLYYPEDYIDKSHSPVLQFDLNWNFIVEYPTIAAAGKDNNINPGNISSSLCDGRHYANGYNWIYKKNVAKILRDCGMHVVIYALKLLYSPLFLGSVDIQSDLTQ